MAAPPLGKMKYLVGYTMSGDRGSHIGEVGVGTTKQRTSCLIRGLLHIVMQVIDRFRAGSITQGQDFQGDNMGQVPSRCNRLDPNPVLHGTIDPVQLLPLMYCGRDITNHALNFPGRFAYRRKTVGHKGKQETRTLPWCLPPPV